MAAIVLLAILLPLGLFGTVANLASASVLLLLAVFAVAGGLLAGILALFALLRPRGD